MNRKLLWMTAAFVLVFAAGCDSKEKAENADNTKKQPAQTEEKNHKDNSDEMPDSNLSPGNDKNEENETNAVPPEIQKITEQIENWKIHYPQLINMQDAGMQKQINNLVKNEVTSFANQYQEGKLNVDYQIMMHTDNTLTILYTAKYSGGMYPTELILTTNIDLRNGTRIKLKDVAVIDEDFVNKFLKAPYLDPENPAIPNKEKQAAVLDYLNSVDEPDLVNALKQGDQSTMDANPYGVYSYLQDDSIIVSIQVPHALGDHAEFRIGLN